MSLTLSYRERVIVKRGIRCLSIHGSESDKSDAKDLLRLISENPDCVRWMITEELSNSALIE